MYTRPGVHFLAMPRTASKAVREALYQRGFKISGGHHDISEFENIVQPNDIVFSTIRNHFDWFVSFWYLNGCPDKFDRYVTKTCRESRWVKKNPDCTRCELYWEFAPKSTHLLRYEHLQDDLDELFKSMNIKQVQLTQNGMKKPRPYQCYYRKGTVKYIEDRFGDELSKYGYEF